MALPTLTIDEVGAGYQNPKNEESKKVLEGLLNDYMDLQYGKETPYTTGKQIVPSGSTIADVDAAIAKETDEKYKKVYEKISQTEKSGDYTPQSKSDGTWDAKFTPVLVLVRPNDRN